MQSNIESSEKQNDFITTENLDTLNTKYKPEDLSIGHFFIPGTLGKAEYEEIAARIIYMAQQEGRFIAPAYRAVGKQIVDEIDERDRRRMEASKNIQKSPPKSPKKTIREWLARVVGKKNIPENPVEEEQPLKKESPLPHSVLIAQSMFYRNIIPDSIREMITKRYLNLVSEDGLDFLEPTEKLIEAIKNRPSKS